jgi:hypothetical protein
VIEQMAKAKELDADDLRYIEMMWSVLELEMVELRVAGQLANCSWDTGCPQVRRDCSWDTGCPQVRRDCSWDTGCPQVRRDCSWDTGCPQVRRDCRRRGRGQSEMDPHAGGAPLAWREKE